MAGYGPLTLTSHGQPKRLSCPAHLANQNGKIDVPGGTQERCERLRSGQQEREYG
jgi:hypothetical protein